MFLRLLSSLFLLMWLCACGEPRYNFDVKGADEFVMDSYKIRQGKLAILEMEGIPTCPMPLDSMEEYTDLIAEDDILHIAIYHPSRQDLIQAVANVGGTIGYHVRGGEVCLPQLCSIKVAGLTLEQARERIKGAYDKEIQGVEVFVEYQQRLSGVVEITGMRSAMIPVNGRVRLYDVLAIAGVPSNANLFMSYVLRGGRALPVDLYKLIHNGDMTQNIVMKPRDRIYLADCAASTAMMMGEVGHPTIIPLPKGYLSLREAIVGAGGIPFTGDKSCIQVIRGNVVCPKVYLLNWNHIVTLPNHSLLLMPGDTVYISEKPITQWNRFIEQLFPTSAGLRTVGDTAVYCGV